MWQSWRQKSPDLPNCFLFDRLACGQTTNQDKSMHRTVKSESVLFYHANPAMEFMALNARLVDAFARTGIKLRPRLATETELAFALGGVTLSVSLSQTPLDVRAFANINRPKAPTTTETTARKRLNQHCAAVVINVSGPLTQAKLETQLAICFIATQQMQELAPPNMIHWAKSNVLYTSEEFRSATGAHDPAPARADAKPALPPVASIAPEIAAKAERNRLSGRTAAPRSVFSTLATRRDGQDAVA